MKRIGLIWLFVLLFSLNFATAVVIEGDWRDFSWNVLTNVTAGDTVIMNDSTVNGFSDGEVVYFEIREHTGANADIRVDENNITGYYNASLGSAIGYWTITQEDLLITQARDDFKFSVYGTSGFSPSIEVFNVSEDEQMNLTILGPFCGEYYDNETTNYINVSVFDNDDLITGEVRVIDGHNDSNPDFVFSSGGVHRFSYDFNVTGNVRVDVSATNTRGVSMGGSSSVIIIDNSQDGEYLASCMTSPTSILTNSSTVLVNASGTKGFRYFSGNDTAYEISKSEMTFNWEFIDVDSGDRIINPVSDGSDPLSYLFEITFAEVGRKVANLEVLL